MSNSWCKSERYHVYKNIERVLQKAPKAPFFSALAWVTAERHVSSDERRRVSLHRIWLTLSDSSVPGQFRHTDIKHIKCLSQHFTWHRSSTLICYPWRAAFCRRFSSGISTVLSSELKKEKKVKHTHKGDEFKILKTGSIEFFIGFAFQRQYTTLILHNRRCN